LYSNLIDKLARECYDKYDNINFMLDRPKKIFNQKGRAQDEQGSINIDNAIIEMFKAEKLPFFWLKGLEEEAVNIAFKYIARKGSKAEWEKYLF